MKPARFDYAQPDTVAQALELLAQHGDAARILAGGQSLVAMLNMRLLSPELLIDISQLSELKNIKRELVQIEVGAAVTQQALLEWPALSDAQPLLAKVLPWVGHYQTRNRGTVCGSLVHADPSSELPLVLALLDGEVVVRNRGVERVLSAREFHIAMMSTSVKADEMVIAVRFPCAGAASTYAFAEVSQRHGDFAIAAIGVVADAQVIRIGIAGLADIPAVFTLPWDSDAVMRKQLNDIAWTLGATDDAHASARYRRELVRRVGLGLLTEVRDALSKR
jgi:2-furoyl-CoA dehydrogenase FAD binding subunit